MSGVEKDATEEGESNAQSTSNAASSPSGVGEEAAPTDESAANAATASASGSKAEVSDAAATPATADGAEEGEADSSVAFGNSGVADAPASKKRSHSSNSGGGKQKRRHRSKGSRGSSGSRNSAAKTESCKIGFLGAGRMTDSIVAGLLKAGKVKAKQIYVAARTGKNLDTFKTAGASVTTRSYDLFGRFDCDVVFLCVHGHVVCSCFKMGGTRPSPITTNYILTHRRPIFILSLIGGLPLIDIKMTLLNPE